MSEHTGISWAHHTQNLWWGCEKVSPACDHCYAERDAKRYGFDVWGLDKPRRFFKPEHYDAPIGWNAKAARVGERRRVFVNSMADIGEFHPDPQMRFLMDAARADLFTRVIPQTPWLDYLLLSKRPANYATIVPPAWSRDGWPANVWPGITAENQEWFDRRVEYLLAVPAAVRWISYEPALGAVDFRRGLQPCARRDHMHTPERGCWNVINWIISGGESGAGFRPDDLAYHRAARDQCHAAGAAYFFKQHGGLHPKGLGDYLDGQQYHEIPVAV